ncbi:flagellar biosynthetic protein FliO [Colwellia sp. RE-S-Sl-9]
MQTFWFFVGAFFSSTSFAEEKTVQVGKHVTASTDPVTMILSLFLVLLVVIASAYLLKKFQITAQGNNQGLKVVTSVHLGTKERVVVVQVADKQLVLGVTANQITLLDTLDKPLETGKSATEFFDKSVVNMLKKSIKKND